MCTGSHRPLIMTIEEQPPKGGAANVVVPSSSNHGLPLPDPCLSFWQQTTRNFPHLNANRHTSLPSQTRYLVIGTGIAGALTAYHLIHSANIPATDLLLLEAREAASGASSRNAGHVRPDAFRGFQVYQRLHGTEQALAILANERACFHAVDEFVAKHNVPCDFVPATTLDVCLTEEFAQFNAASFALYRDAGGDVSHVAVYEGADAVKRTGIEGTVSAYEWPAGSSHPAKLAQWLLAQCIDAGAQLFTHCPAERVTAGDDGIWDVHTPRGVVRVEKVVHCTNAFAGHLLPQLARHVTPNRAQAHALVPPPALAGSGMLDATMSLRHTLHHFYSIMQRRADGILVLGASRLSPTVSEAAQKSIFTTDDSRYNEEVVVDVVGEFQRCFPAARSDALRHGEGLMHSWTGILGMTTDSVPFVGALEELPGQYICAGFNGHGMARIFTCAPGLVKIMGGDSWESTGLPLCFDVTKDRLDRLAQGAKETVF